MPEGDTIHKVAGRIAELVQGAVLEHVEVAGRPAPRLVGQPIDAIRTRGKHLLVGLGPEAVLHVHLGMHGSWHAYVPEEPWGRSPRRAGVVLRTADHVVVCFNPQQCELLDARRVHQHPRLAALGPDLLDDSPDLPTILDRARRSDAPTVGELLLSQRVACGVGNVYKSESLFLEGLDPWRDPRQLGDDTLTALFRHASALLKANLGPGRRITTAPGQRSQVWVYRRSGRPCLRCRSRIRGRRQGVQGRMTYWCPACQRDETPESSSTRGRGEA